MTRFYCIYCGRVYDKGEISRPMTAPNGAISDWVWMDARCPGCRKGFDDWYSPCSRVDRFNHTLRSASLNAIHHPRVKRKGTYIGHWKMEE